MTGQRTANRADHDDDLMDDLTDEQPWTWRFRCRRGHRLRFVEDEVLREVQAGRQVVWLLAR